MALVTVAALATAAAAPAGPTVEVKVSRSGYEPARIVVRRGETARLLIAATDAEPCFAIDALRVEKRVRRGEVTRLELTPERAGGFPFYCCLETGEAAAVERGQLTVTEETTPTARRGPVAA